MEKKIQQESFKKRMQEIKKQNSIWLEALVPSDHLQMKFEIDLHPALIFESIVFLTAAETHQKKIQIICEPNDHLSLRAFLKIVEYCGSVSKNMDQLKQREEEDKDKESSLQWVSEFGIFGEKYMRECLAMARYLELTFLIQHLKSVVV